MKKSKAKPDEVREDLIKKAKKDAVRETRTDKQSKHPYEEHIDADSIRDVEPESQPRKKRKARTLGELLIKKAKKANDKVISEKDSDAFTLRIPKEKLGDLWDMNNEALAEALNDELATTYTEASGEFPVIRVESVTRINNKRPKIIVYFIYLSVHALTVPEDVNTSILGRLEHLIDKYDKKRPKGEAWVLDVLVTDEIDLSKLSDKVKRKYNFTTRMHPVDNTQLRRVTFYNKDEGIPHLRSLKKEVLEIINSEEEFYPGNCFNIPVSKARDIDSYLSWLDKHLTTIKDPDSLYDGYRATYTVSGDRRTIMIDMDIPKQIEHEEEVMKKRRAKRKAERDNRKAQENAKIEAKAKADEVREEVIAKEEKAKKAKAEALEKENAKLEQEIASKQKKNIKPDPVDIVRRTKSKSSPAIPKNTTSGTTTKKLRENA